jgi:serine/threonine protein kinase
LGSGAFATVWLAEDDVLHSWVAVKVLAENWADQPDIRERFEQEARMLRRTDSERVVRILDFGELPDGRPYQVMTYATGGTRAERLAGGPIPVRTGLRITADIARAVTDRHGAGVLHHDLKPSYVLFDTGPDGERVLVADLGLAKAIAQASGFTIVAGTPGYMAPEQAGPAGGVDVRADVHAVGAIAYRMLTGQAPPPHPAAPSKLRPGIPSRVDRIVLRALDPDRDRRWPTTAELAAALDETAAAAPRRRNRAGVVLGRTVGGLAAVAALTCVAGSVPAQLVPSGWVRVADASGVLSVAVPAQRAGQVRDRGWDPASVELPGGSAPGLVVAADLSGRTPVLPACSPGAPPGSARRSSPLIPNAPGSRHDPSWSVG